MKFPNNFCDIGNKTFEWVFENKKKFVDHTIKEMCKPTGLFKVWQDYCLERKKEQEINDRTVLAKCVAKPTSKH